MLNHWTAADLANITEGKWYGSLLPEAGWQTAHIDSREMQNHDLFFALPGTHTDGHSFISALDASHTAIVQRPVTNANAAQLCVPDVMNALCQLAKAAMNETQAAKIAVTGSVGKTGTKDALFHILSAFGPCHASRGNFNNHIGAPLSMVRCPDEAEMIIMEMGMNHAGEIAPLSALFAGDIAIITKIAASHIGHFASLDDIAAAKAEIFAGMTSGIAILPADDDYFDYLQKAALAQGLDIISFGASDAATIQLQAQGSVAEGQDIIICNRRNGQSYELRLGLHAPHHAMVALIGIAVCEALRLDIEKALPHFATLQEMPGRGAHLPLSLHEAHQTILIDDSYNAGPDSMQAALRYLATFTRQKVGLVLTDMLELGAYSNAAHQGLIAPLLEIKPHLLWLVGEEMSALSTSLSHLPDCRTSAEASSILPELANALGSCDVVLVKGSNGSGAPQIAAALRAYHHTTADPLEEMPNAS